MLIKSIWSGSMPKSSSFLLAASTIDRANSLSPALPPAKAGTEDLACRYSASAVIRSGLYRVMIGCPRRTESHCETWTSSIRPVTREIMLATRRSLKVIWPVVSNTPGNWAARTVVKVISGRVSAVLQLKQFRALALTYQHGKCDDRRLESPVCVMRTVATSTKGCDEREQPADRSE